MKLHKLILTAVAGSLLFVSCSDDDSNNKPSGAYDNGMLILNEGNFGKGNASISFLSDAAGAVVENNIFANVNNGDILGDTGQDIGLEGDLAYIVLNVSNKIEIVNRYTFAKVATISSGLTNPRYIAFANGKAYVTCWGDATVTTDDYVAVINLALNNVGTTIPVAEGPERIVEENGKLYVAHKGGYGYGNTVSVIEAASNSVTKTITVGNVPGSLEVENGNLYVLSNGMPSWGGTETAGQIDVISLSNNTVTKTIAFTDLAHPSNLVIEDNNIFYTVDNGIFTTPLSSLTLPSTPLFTTTDQGVYGIYAFAVEDGHIYIGDAGDYKTPGKVFVYSATGSLTNTYTVGLLPSGFFFND
ncbi:YncE family protein [Flavobacterium hauense]